ncbi:helix-turn-helix domain-containing protein [Novosphingobium sp. AAP93]|uniref:helix-turn-helix domain-containing protein n=1 Tax=Novosphingobium sp. AAP93 TaxID=1523427 RepID=UPI0018D0B32B|nr:helix-turn-helix domain-containing protein [Novosphingobium sp. AAP93]
MPGTTMNDGSYAVAEDGERNTVSPDRTDTGGSGSGAESPRPPVVDAHASVSGRLVVAREALGLSAAEIARRTRVTIRHIEALEAGDYSALPGRPYAIGFAKAYARAVGLGETEIADAVRLELQGRAPRPEPRVLNQFEVGDPAKTPSRLVGWLALLLVGALLAMGGIFWRSYYAPAVSLPSLVQEADQPAPVAKPNAVRPAQPATAQPLANGPVMFSALEEGIWVKFYDGQGKQLMQKQLAKGESYTVPADAVSPKLWTGRPDALAITIGGQPIPRLAEVEKVMKDIPVDAASLRARPPIQPSIASPAPIAQ